MEIMRNRNILGKGTERLYYAIGFDLYNKIIGPGRLWIGEKTGRWRINISPKCPEPADVKVKLEQDAFFPDEYSPRSLPKGK